MDDARGASRRIVIVVGALTAGGAERVAATMANAWSERGGQVWIVATFLGPRVASYPLHPAVSLVFLDQLTSVSAPRWSRVWRKLWAMRKLLRTIRPDIVISFLTNVNVLVIAARAASGIPLIVSERTDPVHDVKLPRVLRMARSLCYRFADALVVQTAAAAERYGARLRSVSRIAVIPNPLPAALAASPLRARQESDGGVVLAMGRLSREKGYATLLHAFAQGLGKDPAWQLRVWGEGPLREELQRLVERLQLTDRTTLCGLTEQPWMALAAGQIFVLSSEYEGFPNAMLEAMALGLPCIAFDCPSGVRELADGGRAAILLPPGDTQRLAIALRDLVRDRELRETLGARAAAFVRSSFEEHSIMDRWDSLIGELLTAARTKRLQAARNRRA